MFSIRLKIVVSILVVLVLVTGIVMFLTLSIQRRDLLEATQANLLVNNQILNGVLKNLMLAGEAPIAENTLKELKSIQNFEELAIYRTDGSIAFNDFTTIDTVNQNQDRFQFEETPRVEKVVFDSPAFKKVLNTNTPVYSESEAEQKMEFFFPILNYKDCRFCHGSDEFIRGVAYYRVSTASIYDRVDNARNLLLVVFGLGGVFMLGLIIFLMQRIVVSPIFSIGTAVSTVGTGNLEITVDLQGNDELSVLADQINDMITGLKGKRQLELENKEIETTNRENKKYLDNITEGLLLLQPDLRISPQYSFFLTELFDIKEMSGLDFCRLIFPKEEKREQRKELREFINLLFTNTVTDMEMIDSVNPLKNARLTINGDSGEKTIDVDTSFTRIIEDNEVINVMVIFEDRTEIVQIGEALESEKKHRQRELELVASLLKTGPEQYQSFINEVRETINTIGPDPLNFEEPETVAELFRQLHSAKGTARYYEYLQIAEALHETETIIADVRDKKRPAPEALQELPEKTAAVLAAINEMEEIQRRFQSFTAGEISEKSSEQYLASFADMITSLAKELNKKVTYQWKSELQSFPFETQLRSSIIHLLRNAVDHGIEAPFERIAAGKTEEGSIICKLTEDAGQFTLIIEDDGSGIDFESIRKRAVEKELMDPEKEYSKKDMLKLLFSPAFSTRTESSEISGRGVGLDSVYHEVKKLNGSISVKQKKTGGTIFSIRLPKQENV